VSKIVVTRDALTPALARAAALVPGRTTIPILGCVKLEMGPDGLTLSTTDCDAWYCETVDREKCEPWSGCVDAARLHSFVHSLSPGSPVELAADDSALTIAGADTGARLGVLPGDDFPIVVLRSDEGVTFEVEAAALSAALRFVEPSASKDDRRHYLCGAYIDPDGVLVTTDVHRMAVYRFAVSLPAFEGVILPLPAQRLLPSLLKGFAATVTVTVTPRVIEFTNGSWTLRSRLIDATFPEWRRVLPARSATPIVIEAAALRAAVGRVAAVIRTPGTKTSAARLRLEEGRLRVSAVTDTADAEVVTMIAVSTGPGEKIEIALSARYLSETLGVLEAERVELHLPANRGGSVWMCDAGETENGVIIVPMRV
jgi:DNA polymerase-3 subunit beta